MKSVPYALHSCIVLCLTLAMLLCCTGCAPTFSIDSGNKQKPDDARKEELPDIIDFPKEYLITYEIEDAYGTLHQVSGGKDADGRVYFKRQMEELLFVPTDEGYYQYSIDTDGILTSLDNTVRTREYVEEMTEELFGYARKYTLYQSETASYIDKTQIAGRDCLVYEVNITVAALSQKYTFAVDEETGACMEWKLASKVMDHALPADIGFTCIEFVTTNVKLPIPD